MYGSSWKCIFFGLISAAFLSHVMASPKAGQDVKNYRKRNQRSENETKNWDLHERPCRDIVKSGTVGRLASGQILEVFLVFKGTLQRFELAFNKNDDLRCSLQIYSLMAG